MKEIRRYHEAENDCVRRPTACRMLTSKVPRWVSRQSRKLRGAIPARPRE